MATGPRRRVLVHIVHEHEGGVDRADELWKDADDKTLAFLDRLQSHYSGAKWPEQVLQAFSRMSVAKRVREPLGGAYIEREYNIHVSYANTESVGADQEEEEDDRYADDSEEGFIDYEDEEEQRAPVERQKVGGTHSDTESEAIEESDYDNE